MPRSPFNSSQHPGILHHYTSRLVAFEHGASSDQTDRNVLLWIGGLGDGLLTVPYTTAIAASLPSNWCLVQPVLFSTYTGWTVGSLNRDAKELGRCVEYFKNLRPGLKIVLMGHSTGSQDCMEYLVGEESKDRPDIQGVILQSGISDREGMVAGMEDGMYEKSCKIALQWVDEGRGDDVLPLSVTTKIFGTPCTASRWLSLASPDKNGPDDYFSSDLDMQKLESTFGKLPKESPLLILFGGADAFVPPHVDRKGLVAKWTDVVKRGGGVVDEDHGGIIEGATHNLMGDPDHVVQDLVRRVVGFLERVDRSLFASGAHL